MDDDSYDVLTAVESGDVQSLIDSGAAWTLEGHVGRTCMAAIENGDAMLGPHPVRNAYGSIVPAWWMVDAGTKGSPEFAGRERPEEPSKEAKLKMLDAVGLKVSTKEEEER